MSCKSCLYAANLNSQTVAVGGNVNFGTAVRRAGSNCDISGGNAVIEGTGYYDVYVSLTLTGSATGTAIATLYKDGVEVPGAVAAVTTAASTVYAIAIPAIVRETCCCNSSTLSVTITGSQVTVTNAAIIVKKV